jgi:hypothetical protein
MADQPLEDAKLNLSEKVWEKLIKLIQTFSDTRIGVLRGRDGLRCYGGRNDMEIYKDREIETEQLNDGKWIVCAQDNNGVMVVARPGWHYMTEEDGIEDVERLIDQSLERRQMKTGGRQTLSGGRGGLPRCKLNRSNILCKSMGEDDLTGRGSSRISIETIPLSSEVRGR